MPKKAIIESYLDREIAVIEEIRNKEEISQNELMKIIVNCRKLMAKNTFEKTLKAIQLKRLADFRKEGNKKIWYIEGLNVQKFQELEKFIKDMEKKLPTISKEFHKKTLTDKSQEVTWLFSLYAGNMSFLNLMYELENTPKREFDKSMQLMSRFLKLNVSIWKKDKDSEYLIAELMLTIIKTNPFFADVTKVLGLHMGLPERL